MKYVVWFVVGFSVIWFAVGAASIIVTDIRDARFRERHGLTDRGRT